ncbi:MAG: glycosyltransferase family 2 protein [Thermoanaerobaculia bacterium]|nr:glycosyltransferase family 2 protein [Thermoanaerobaculia bacterium]
MSEPLVSVIVTTYNRSDVLRLAIGSALAQTFEDFEIVVVGDACTDDTAEVVAGLGDPRIRFTNLPENHGDQSGPSNAGLAMSRGRYIAYLNHDDLWWPDHLELTVAALAAGDANGVFTLLDSVHPDGGGDLHGACPEGLYHPLALAPASSWLLRRRLVQELGGWRPSGRLYNIPSQDLLFRAWKSGKRLRLVPVLTVLACHSGHRPGVYLRPDGEVAFWAERLATDPEGLRAERLTRLATAATLRLEQPGALTAFKQLLRVWGKRFAALVGVHWISLGKFVRHGRRGGHLAALRRLRGLPPRRRGPGPGASASGESRDEE